MVAEMLRHSPDLLHLRAECSPFLRLVGLGFNDDTGSDRLDAAHAQGLDDGLRHVLDHELSLDAGVPTPSIADDEEFALDAVFRLAIQWPETKIDVDLFAGVALEIIERLRRRCRWSPCDAYDLAGFQIGLLQRLRMVNPAANPWYYDLSADRLRALDLPVPPGAPAGLLIEETPFVVPQVWRRAQARDLENKALVIKAPSNAYRMDFLRALFPNAEIRVVHLTRNPAAAINGLYDGWRHCGFHSQALSEPLRIPGYCDVRPADRRWWKFDQPPGWQEHRESPLMRVCAFQWRSCHQAILADPHSAGPGYLRIRFEDLVSAPDVRLVTLRRLAAWLDVPLDNGFLSAARDGIGPVAATKPPMPGRWHARAEQIRPVIDANVRTIASELGYDVDDTWI
jgi:hypothetical protein